jgi:hypothetical protein
MLSVGGESMWTPLSRSRTSFREPRASGQQVVISLEEALSCDGLECGASEFSGERELELLQPHWHMIVKGESPVAGPRCYPIWANDRAEAMR